LDFAEVRQHSFTLEAPNFLDFGLHVIRIRTRHKTPSAVQNTDAVLLLNLDDHRLAQLHHGMCLIPDSEKREQPPPRQVQVGYSRDLRYTYLPTTKTWKLSGRIGGRPFFWPG